MAKTLWICTEVSSVFVHVDGSQRVVIHCHPSTQALKTDPYLFTPSFPSQAKNDFKSNSVLNNREWKDSSSGPIWKRNGDKQFHTKGSSTSWTEARLLLIKLTGRWAQTAAETGWDARKIDIGMHAELQQSRPLRNFRRVGPICYKQPFSPAES